MNTNKVTKYKFINIEGLPEHCDLEELSLLIDSITEELNSLKEIEASRIYRLKENYRKREQMLLTLESLSLS